MKYKKILALLCLMTLLLSLGACGGKSKTGDAQSETQSLAQRVFGYSPKGRFTVACCSMPESFSPVYAEDALSMEFFRLVYDSLWRFDTDGEPEACLAESWDLSEDSLTWTIRLRQDVFFSDGEPLTSSDVKFSYEYLRRYSRAYADCFDSITSIKCPDDYTVVITTSAVKGDLMYNEIPILPEHIWEDYSESPSQMDNAAMVGSGPFLYQPMTLQEGETQTTWTFLANENYFQGSPRIEELCFRYYESASYAADALAYGDADGCMDLTPVQRLTLQNQAGAELFEVQGAMLGTYVIGLNRSSGALEDDRVREAISLCVNTEEISSKAFSGLGAAVGGFMTPDSASYLGEVSREYNPERAALLLAGAFYDDYDGDGVLESLDGTIELSLQVYTATGDTVAQSILTVLKEDLSNLGMELNWQELDTDDVASLCSKGGNWDLYIGRQTGTGNPVTMARRYADGESETGWQSKTYDAAYASLLTCLDAVQQTELLTQLQTIVNEEEPCIVVGYGAEVQAIRADLWTGYLAAAQKTGGLFKTGCIDFYLRVQQSDGESAGSEQNAAESVLSEPYTEAASDVEPG